MVDWSTADCVERADCGRRQVGQPSVLRRPDEIQQWAGSLQVFAKHDTTIHLARPLDETHTAVSKAFVNADQIDRPVHDYGSSELASPFGQEALATGKPAPGDLRRLVNGRVVQAWRSKSSVCAVKPT